MRKRCGSVAVPKKRSHLASSSFLPDGFAWNELPSVQAPREKLWLKRERSPVEG